MTKKLFSIITVTYNAEATITATLESVASQTCDQYEHLIIDGASTDRTLEIVKDFDNPKIILESEPDHGIYDAMNKGISIANGKYFIFLNAGDRFHSTDILQLYADKIYENDYPGIVYGQTDLVDDNGKYLGPRHITAPPILTLDDMKKGMVVCHQAMAVYYRIVNDYDINLRYSADYDWVIMCLMHSKHNIYVDRTVVDYLCEGTTTRHHKESLMERFRIMCRYFGTFPTLARHISFAFRYLRRRNKSANIQ